MRMLSPSQLMLGLTNVNARPKQSVVDARPYKSCKVVVKHATEHCGVYSTF